MGLFDLPSPLFAWLDHMAAMVLPAWLRLAIWGALAASISMLAYWRLSDQAAIEREGRTLKSARRHLNRFDGDLKDALPLMRTLLMTALRQVARVGWPAMAAVIPMLFFLNWLSTSYGYTYPATGETPAVQARPPDLHASWVDPPNGVPQPPRILITGQDAQPLADVPLKAPVPVIQKKHWWNLLMGNPAGYLPAQAPVDSIEARLPRRELLPFGPEWMRSWEIVFFGSLLTVSLGLRKALKIK